MRVNFVDIRAESLVDIIWAALNAKDVEIQMNEDVSCCGKINTLHKIGEMIIDFKQVYKEKN